MGFLPSVKCICPSCFEEIDLGACKIVSGITHGKVLKEPARGAFARMRVEPLTGRQYTLEQAHRQCYNCGYLLPPNIESVPSIIITIVGDNFSGKSHYIAALIHQLRTDWINNASGYVQFSCLTPEVAKDYQDEYFRPLLQNKTTIRPTPFTTKSTADPLIYNLTVGDSPIQIANSINLMIYDVSGEAFANIDKLVQSARFALNTNAFLFVVDPFTMPMLFEQLSPALQSELQQYFDFGKDRRAIEPFNNAMSTFKQFHQNSGSRLPNTPIGIMLTKSDLFKNLQKDPLPYQKFMDNPPYGGELDLTDLRRVDEEVRNLLRRYDQGDLIAATKGYSKVGFFATSATGNPAINSTYAAIEPCRCLDPMLWILNRLQLINGR